jgi:putative SOS response-associated peptidase YedK
VSFKAWAQSPAGTAAPSQELLVIRRNRKTGEVTLDPLRWGLIPYWRKDPAGGRRPINAKCETVRDLPTFRDAYRRRRCVVPVDGFFEWRAVKGRKAKQPYAIAMKDDAPFGLAGIWLQPGGRGGAARPRRRASACTAATAAMSSLRVMVAAFAMGPALCAPRASGPQDQTSGQTVHVAGADVFHRVWAK